jgi:hypothetical protein
MGSPTTRHAPNDWRHSVCDTCWVHMAADHGVPGRTPARVTNFKAELCCYCGKWTVSGIYVRANPAAVRLQCRGPEA